MATGVFIGIGAWVLVVLIFALTFNQETWDRKHKNSLYSAESNWRDSKEFWSRMADRVPKRFRIKKGIKK